MKKYAIVILLACGLLGWASYNYFVEPPGSTNKSKPIAAIIQEEVTTINVIHTVSGISNNFVIEGNALDELKIWVADLQYEHIMLKVNSFPEKSNNMESYKFEINEGDYAGFTYIMAGSESYLLIDGEYYLVSNPSPLTFIL